MAVADTLIADETIVFESKKHWMAPIRASLVAAAMFVGAVVLCWISPDGDGFFSFVGTILDLVAIGLVIGGIGWIVYNVVAWRTARVRRHQHARPARGRSGAEAQLDDAAVVAERRELERRLPGRQARLRRHRAADAVGRRRRGPLPVHHDADRVPERGHEPEDGRSARRCGPLAAPAASPVARRLRSAPAARPRCPRPRPRPRIASLADLRDRGAITPEEFEAKKAELLARM